MQTIISEYGGFLRYLKNSADFNSKRLLIVSGKKSFHMSGGAAMVENGLNCKSITYFSDFETNPKANDAIKGARLAEANNIDAILAIGGGSVLDMAKLIKAFIYQQGNEDAIIYGDACVNESTDLPIIAVPTTAGSGSESTHFAVIYKDKIKYSIAATTLLPNKVILDGSLLMSATSHQKACNILDALAQSIEASWAVKSNDAVRKKSFLAARMIVKSGAEYVKSIKNPELFQTVITASNLAGQSINITKTTAPHAWSYGLTSSYGVPHGLAVWFTMPMVFQIHYERSLHDKASRLHKTMLELLNIFNIKKTENCADLLNKYCEMLQVSVSFDRLGITKDDRIRLMEEVNMERMSNNPVQFTKAEQEKIFCI